MNSEMESNFSIPGQGLDETKEVIRSLDSLRFKSNPFQIGNKYHISLSGDVKDMNQLYKHLAKYSPKEEPKLSFRNKLKRLRKILLVSNEY